MLNSPQITGSQKKRVIIALTGFTVVLCIIFMVAANYMGEEGSRGGSKGIKQVTSVPTFYKTIGQAPANIKAMTKSAINGPIDRFTLEFKVANSRHEAEKLIDLLGGMGIRAYFTPLSRHGKIVYRVRHGMYPSLKDAKRKAISFRSQNKVATKIVKLQ